MEKRESKCGSFLFFKKKVGRKEREKLELAKMRSEERCIWSGYMKLMGSQFTHG